MLIVLSVSPSLAIPAHFPYSAIGWRGTLPVAINERM